MLRRHQFSILLLAPFALMLTVFARHVVGLNSIGTFLPVLLGFSLAQTGWAVGGLQIAVALVLGVAVRFLMGRLHLLHVPRTAVLITLLVGLFLVLSVTLDLAGSSVQRGSIILPLAALAMTIERYTFVAMDKGLRSATWLLVQTFLLAAVCYGVLTTPFFKAMTVAFPEVLLLVAAQIIILGSYRGLRWTERWRFRHVPKPTGAAS